MAVFAARFRYPWQRPNRTIQGDARVNKPSLNAREIEALVYVFGPDDRASLVPGTARSRRSVRSPVVIVGPIAGLVLLGTLLRLLFVW